MPQHQSGWAVVALVALLLAAAKGLWLKRAAVSVAKPQHLHLTSALATIAFAVGFVVVKAPPDPHGVAFLLLCLFGGVAYTAFGALSFRAQRHLSFSSYNSTMRIGGMVPVAAFWLLGERPSAAQWIGIFTSVIPLLLIQPEGSEGASRLRGLVPALGAVLATAALQVINKIAMEPEHAIDPMMFVLGMNIVSAPVAMAGILRTGERLGPDRVQVAWWGAVAGLLNFLSFGTYLHALSIGPASVIVPLNSQHVVVSGVIADAPRSKRKLALGLAVALSIAATVLLVQEGVR